MNSVTKTVSIFLFLIGILFILVSQLMCSPFEGKRDTILYLSFLLEDAFFYAVEFFQKLNLSMM
jgi:hypothetical protein